MRTQTLPLFRSSPPPPSAIVPDALQAEWFADRKRPITRILQFNDSGILPRQESRHGHRSIRHMQTVDSPNHRADFHKGRRACSVLRASESK